MQQEAKKNAVPLDKSPLGQEQCNEITQQIYREIRQKAEQEFPERFQQAEPEGEVSNLIFVLCLTPVFRC